MDPLNLKKLECNIAPRQKKIRGKVMLKLIICREYPDTVPFVQMRAFGALFGALVIPLAYLTIRGCGHSNMAAIAAAIAICFGK